MTRKADGRMTRVSNCGGKLIRKWEENNCGGKLIRKWEERRESNMASVTTGSDPIPSHVESKLTSVTLQSHGLSRIGDQSSL